MAGLVPAIHVFLLMLKDVDARDKPGHDGGVWQPVYRFLIIPASIKRRLKRRASAPSLQA
jgi:hypothetical protein